MKVICIIPARYKSTRLPGKMLADIAGKTIIQRVYEQVSEAFDDVYVATDHQYIRDEVNSFGGEAIMTPENLQSGTERCAWALDKINEGRKNLDDQIVINVQGDEPMLDPQQLTSLVDSFQEPGVDISTLVKQTASHDVIFNENKPKVVINKNGFALYFSRATIPYVRDEKEISWPETAPYYFHIGLYAYKTHILKEIVNLPESHLEKAESLEQLRWLENGYRIKTKLTDHEGFSVDTPSDLKKMREMF